MTHPYGPPPSGPARQPAQQQPQQPEHQPAQPPPPDQPAQGQPQLAGDAGRPVTAVAAKLTDGEWHRLHPSSPLLKGGLFLLAIVGYLIAQARERIIELFIPGAGAGNDDPLTAVVESGFLGWAILALAGILIVLIVSFYLSWRMHTFRITDEVVEVRSGLVFRTNRKARLDRIQGINIVRPFIARLFGAAKVEVNQAGQDANVKLEYLATGAADDLRREILRLASGTRASSGSRPATNAAGETVLDRRVGELLAPELDPDAAEPESVVKLGAGRLLGSIALSGGSIFVVLAIATVIIVSIFAPEALLGLFGLIPAAIGFIGYSISKFVKSLRYSIAGTPDGVRVGFGLLSTSNETLPPGRIHSVKVSQPLLWRPFGWWEVKVNRASHSSTNGAAGQQNTTILPVGTLDDVRRVLGLMLPEFSGADQAGETARALADQGLAQASTDDGYTVSPRRASVLRWFSWRRNGFAVSEGAALLRKGAIWRELIVVPFARSQSVSVQQGPLLRRLDLSSVHVHTVSGPIVASLGALARESALTLFAEVADGAIRSSHDDTSHRWGAGAAARADAAPVASSAPTRPFGPPPTGPAVSGAQPPTS